MKILTDFRKTVKTGVDPRLIQMFKSESNIWDIRSYQLTWSWQIDLFTSECATNLHILTPKKSFPRFAYPRLQNWLPQKFYFTLFSVDGSKAIETHLVHEAVEQSFGPILVNSELASRCIIVMFFDVFAFLCATSYANHPQELVDIWCDLKKKS